MKCNACHAAVEESTRCPYCGAPALPDRPRERDTSRKAAMIYTGLLVFWALLFPFLIPMIVRVSRSDLGRKDCQMKLLQVETSLARYHDATGRYPEKLEQLTPDYLQCVPTCPVYHKDTYSEGYQVEKNHYVLSCSAAH